MTSNTERAADAERALHAFMRATGADSEDAISDLIGDLCHLAQARGLDHIDQVRRGLYHHFAETHDERTASVEITILPDADRERADHVLVFWNSCTEERFDEMLGCVPPVTMQRGGFLVGEASDHRPCRVSKQTAATYAAFVRVGDSFFEATEPMTIAEFRAARLPVVQP